LVDLSFGSPPFEPKTICPTDIWSTDVLSTQNSWVDHQFVINFIFSLGLSLSNFDFIKLNFRGPGKSYRRGRLSKVDLLVLTSLEELFYIENNGYVFNTTSYLNEEVSRTEASPLVNTPWQNQWHQWGVYLHLVNGRIHIENPWPAKLAGKWIW